MEKIEKALKYFELFRKEAIEMLKSGKDIGGILAEQVPACDTVIEALEKQVAKDRGYTEDGRMYCTICKKDINIGYHNYCSYCGQKLEV